jgi:hypothetical protein
VNPPAIIIAGLVIIGGLILLWFAFKRWGPSPDGVLEEAEEAKARIEPETSLEQTTIESASGELLPPDVRLAIGGARWGRPVRRRYVPEEYDGPIACLLCGRPVLPGQFFWETPLISRETGEETGEAFQLCLSCRPGDVAAVIHRGP